MLMRWWCPMSNGESDQAGPETRRWWARLKAKVWGVGRLDITVGREVLSGTPYRVKQRKTITTIKKKKVEKIKK